MSKEGLKNTGLLSELAGRRYDFDVLSKRELAERLGLLLARGRLTELGQDFYEDALEMLFLTDPAEVIFARSLGETAAKVKTFLGNKDRVLYITGGMEGLHLQIILNGLMHDGFGGAIIGLEEDCYVRAKGREPFFTTQEKVSLWLNLAPKGVVFVIPPRPREISTNNYCDWVASQIGVIKNDQIYYLGSRDDPEEIKQAHSRRAFSLAHVLEFSLGRGSPVHTSELLIRGKNLPH